MRIKILKAIPGAPAVGEFFTVEDEVIAKQYVAAGYAEEAPEADAADPVTQLKGLVGDIAKAVRAELAAETETKAGKRTGPRIDSVPTELAGLPVFGSAGGYLHAVKDAAAQYPSPDTIEKMRGWQDVQRKAGVLGNVETKAPSGNFEANDPDGGALVIPEFGQTIYERMQLEENFLGQSDSMVVRGNVMTLPGLDDASRANGSRWGGIQGVWANEADQLSTVSKLKARQMDLRLKKLYVFAYMTDELLSDSPYALESYVAKYAAKEIVFKTNDAMISGTGVGVPLGINNSPAKITVAKETGQAAASILTTNIDKMWMRLNWQCRANAVWLINQDCEAILQGMALPVGVAGVPTYLPPGGVSATPYATLKGRPVKVVEFCETLGTEGDIILTDWSQYKTIYKGGVKSDLSMHLRFQYGEMAYRFTYRVDGQPAWDKPLTPYKGTTTTSSIVTLAVRS